MSEEGPTAADMIASEMEKLRSLLVEKATLDELKKREAEEVINEMKLLVDFLKDKKLEDGSCRINYFRSEVVEMARHAQHQIENDSYIPDPIKKELKETNKQLRELGQSQNRDDGVGEGDGDMVGFEEDVKLLLHRIDSHREEEGEETYVACIRGIPGSGKTTLLRHLYSHTDIVQNFDHHVWVDCTEILSHKELLINLLRQLPGGDAAGAEEMKSAHLRQCVFQRLQQGKRFFLVLDYVRRFWLFDEFLESLCIQAKGRCTLLFTSRRMFIPIYGFYNHDMKPLDQDNSWQLLLKMMLLSNAKLPKSVERKGKAMLMKHSGGVPFAIKEVAMEWLEKWRLGIEWEDVVESEDLELRATLAEIDSSVYDNLDPDTKLCFQHLSFFKQGMTIRRRRFLDTLDASGLTFAHLRCFGELESERIIEIQNFTPYSQFGKNVRISPIFHKLSIIKAKKGEDEALHRVINCSRERFNCSMDRNKQILCLSFNGGGCFSGISPSYWKSFEKLRVLEFEGFGLKFLPEAVGELIELRYLGLRDNYIQELPRSLGYLKKLEVLDIAQNFMVEVPDIIWEMDALVDLYMSDIFCKKPLKIEALKNLRTLTNISVDNWAYEVSGLQMMTSLEILGIEGLDGNSDLSKLLISLAVLENLNQLVLRGFRFKSMSLEGLGGILSRLCDLKLDGLIAKLPRLQDFPPYLGYLTLANSNFVDDPMPILEKLHRLEYLKLQNAYTGRQMVISGAGFPNLQRMCIGELWHLRNIHVGGGALELLEILEITSCPYLQSLPKEIINKKNLELNIMATKNIATKTNNSGL